MGVDWQREREQQSRSVRLATELALELNALTSTFLRPTKAHFMNESGKRLSPTAVTLWLLAFRLTPERCQPPLLLWQGNPVEINHRKRQSNDFNASLAIK